MPSYRLTTVFFSADALRRISISRALPSYDERLEIEYPSVPWSQRFSFGKDSHGFESCFCLTGRQLGRSSRNIGGPNSIWRVPAELQRNSILRPFRLTNAIATSFFGFAAEASPESASYALAKVFIAIHSFPSDSVLRRKRTYCVKAIVRVSIKHSSIRSFFEGHDAIRTLLIVVGGWSDPLHDEIWVYNQGLWQKDHGLWVDIQKADWKDIILKEEFKNALKKDIYGFFSSRAIYKELAIPWKIYSSPT